jgi:hypothetical protein
MHADLPSSGRAPERGLERIDAGLDRPSDPCDELWAMTPDERVVAMRNGDLSLSQLAAWSRRAPQEVPRIGGEFEWIVVSLIDFIEASAESSRRTAHTIRAATARSRQRAGASESDRKEP